MDQATNLDAKQRLIAMANAIIVRYPALQLDVAVLLGVACNEIERLERQVHPEPPCTCHQPSRLGYCPVHEKARP